MGLHSVANAAHLAILDQGVAAWNAWRERERRQETAVSPDLSNADLRGRDLTRANLSAADLFAADLPGARLAHALLNEANLSRAYLNGAVLTGAHLQRAVLVETELKGTDISGSYVYGAAAWGVETDAGTKQADLVNTRLGAVPTGCTNTGHGIPQCYRSVAIARRAICSPPSRNGSSSRPNGRCWNCARRPLSD
jgi:uncharacterized protein YjbI with pentapeptide repeats